MTQERAERPKARPLDAPLLTFDLTTVVKQIKSEDTWQTAQRNAMTLVRSPTLRVVLIALHQGTVIPSHQAEGPITVQVLEGQITCSAAGQVVTLRTGQMLTLHSGLPHVVEALKETAILLTVTTEATHPAER